LGFGVEGKTIQQNTIQHADTGWFSLTQAHTTHHQRMAKQTTSAEAD